MLTARLGKPGGNSFAFLITSESGKTAIVYAETRRQATSLFDDAFGEDETITIRLMSDNE